VWWLAAAALCVGSTGFLKIYFFVCPPLSDLQSPSGHTSLSTLVYGTLTFAVAVASTGWRRYAAIGAGILFVGGIGISRILIHAHSIPEVMLGSIMGLVALAFFAYEYWRYRPLQPRLQPLLVICVLVMVLLNGQQLRAEDLLHAIGIYLSDHAGMACL